MSYHFSLRVDGGGGGVRNRLERCERQVSVLITDSYANSCGGRTVGRLLPDPSGLGRKLSPLVTSLSGSMKRAERR